MSSLPYTRIPGPPPMRMLGPRGNFIQFLRDPVAYMRRLHQTHGEIAAFVQGRDGMVFAFGPKYNQQLLSNPAVFHCMGITTAGPEGSAHRRLGESLFRMNADHHREQRRLMMQPFHAHCLHSYHDAIVAVAQQMLERWQPRQRYDMASEMKRLAMHVASVILFGLPDYSAVQRLGQMNERWMNMSTSIPVRLLPVDRPGTPYHRMLAHAQRLETQVIEILDQKRRQGPNGSDVLSLLIRAHDDGSGRMTDEELISQTNILLAAGHETTSNALTWTLFLLAQHPAVAADLLDELEGKLHGAPPTAEQLDQLPLLDQVIKESMRLLPPVVYSYRRSVEPFALGPYQLPAGSTVAFSHYITHHLPELYPQPERFLPERWRTIKPSPYEYLPFSAGPRMCMGAAFATMTMKISLPMILQRFRLSLRPGARIDRHVAATLSPKRGMPMLVEPPDRRFAKATVRGNIHEMVELR